MSVRRNAPLIINCDETQMKISQHEYIICQHQSGLGLSHLGFTALLCGKIDLLIFTTDGGTHRSIAFERTGEKFRVFPNGKRDLACDISKWEIEAVDGLIIDCLLGRYADEINIDTELFNIHGKVNFIFMISDFFL